MIRPGTFERVYGALKAEIRSGRYRPGDRLEPAALSATLNASVTPIRDALHRLTGERLVEAPAHEGFRVPLLTEAGLRQLYRWHHRLLALAMKSPAALAGQSAAEDIELRDALLARARLSGEPELIAALESATDRLGALVPHETALLGSSVDDEREAVLASLGRGEAALLRRLLNAATRHRLRIVPALLERLYAAG